MYLKSLELSGFKSFSKKTELNFNSPITAIVGPNGSGKSNVAEAFRFVLGEQSIKSLRGKKGEDLIWNGSKNILKQNRASVKVIFDNTKRLFNVDFDEVSFERVVHRDGVNDYFVNGTQVRLKDIMELLAGAHIGPSGHHIISQGESDRILNANPKERRVMIEDALGLKIYQFKKQESLRKLEKTRENLKSVESLRREIAPHLKFLAKQMEKLERGRALKTELVGNYLEYFKREAAYLKLERQRIEDGLKGPLSELKKLDGELKSAKDALARSSRSDEKSFKVIEFENDLSKLRRKKDDLTRSLGRLEGEIVSEERNLKRLLDDEKTISEQSIALSELQNFAKDFDETFLKIEAEIDLFSVKSLIRALRDSFFDFLRKRSQAKGLAKQEESVKKNLANLQNEKKRLEAELVQVKDDEDETAKRASDLKKEIESEEHFGRAAEREVFRLQTAESSLRVTTDKLKGDEVRLKLEEEEWRRELLEAAALLSREVVNYENVRIFDASGVELADNVIAASEPRSAQGERRRQIEKIKIRIEELGGAGGNEVVKEHREVSERNQFLAREIGDLEKSAESLESLITELDTRLEVLFKEGVKKINAEFNRFFKLMFGGGGASLEVVKEEKRKKVSDEMEEFIAATEEIPQIDEEETLEVKEGIVVSVNLPYKRIRGLEMLSGGERALTSIAILFAISQVNPPPFVVLDETDAALDEANSKKYANMIEDLARYSQLIVITHNRETMSRAGVLYGVTMGQDACSKLLSIQFEEAVQVAK